MHGYNHFQFDVTNQLSQGTNNLYLGLYDWTAVFNKYVNLSVVPEGMEANDLLKGDAIDAFASSYKYFGIWDSVYLLLYPKFYVSDIFVKTSLRNNQIKINLSVSNEDSSPHTIRIINYILDNNSNIVKTLPERQITISANSLQSIEISDTWTNPILWDPNNPYLYNVSTIIVEGTNKVDEKNTRFGFREFWAQGPYFYLNGIKINLHATSTHQKTVYFNKSQVRETLLNIKNGNNNAFRFHAQPWPDIWYEVADEVGLLAIPEGAYFCGNARYNYSDVRFWDYFRLHLEKLVEKEKNHPSVVMWSLENELIHCNGLASYPQMESNLSELGLFVKSIDNTRLITYEADLDPGGVADVIGLHYPHDYPEFYDYPNTAYWMDTPLNDPVRNENNWTWQKNKPLYIGEFLYIGRVSPDMYSILYGDGPYTNFEYYRELAKAETWRMQVEAYRDYEVSGMCPWTEFESFNKSSEFFLDNRTLLYKTQKDYYSPLWFFVKNYDKNFFSNKTIQRDISVFNDLYNSSLSSLRLEWSTGYESGNISFNLGPAELYRVNITFMTPIVGIVTPLYFNVKLYKENNLVYQETKNYTVYPNIPLNNPDVNITLYDKVGLTRNILNRNGINFLEVNDFINIPSDTDLLIIGSNSLVNDPLEVGFYTKHIGDLVSKGMNVLVFEQNYSLLPSLGLIEAPATWALSRAVNSSILQGINGEDLKYWRGDNYVLRKNIINPEKGRYRVIIESGNEDGLKYSPIIELTNGNGSYIFSQLLLTEKFDSEPIANKIMNNLISYSSKVKSSSNSVAVYSDTNNLIYSFLDYIKLNYTKIDLNGDLSNYKTVIISGSDSVWSNVQLQETKLNQFLNRGGNLYFHRLNQSNFQKVRSLTGNDFEIVDMHTFPILKNEYDSITNGLSNYDLYWQKEDYVSWGSLNPLTENITDSVARYVFNLSVYSVLEAESMSIKTTGQSIYGGWNLYANGYIAENINFDQNGIYLFQITAGGTTVNSIYPLMELRVDGVPVDRISLSDTNWKNYTLSAKISTGVHQIAIAFTNDEYNPPEDRNLYLDKMLYGLAPSNPNFIRLTLPTALAKIKKGNGSIIIDNINWENEQINWGRASRYVSNLLTNLNSTFFYNSGFVFEAEYMSYKSTGGPTYGGWNLWANGNISEDITFVDKGKYDFEVVARGTIANNTYAYFQLRVDGQIIGGNYTTSSWDSYQFNDVKINTTGVHKVSIHFTNDLNFPPEDRNLYVDKVVVYPENRIYDYDLNADGCVQQNELMAYISRWQANQVTIPNLIEAVGLWIDNIGC